MHSRVLALLRGSSHGWSRKCRKSKSSKSSGEMCIRDSKEAVFGPAETALREAVASLRAQGVNIVIALTHLGLNVDCELAGRVDGVDVFVGGHTHSLLSNTNPKAVGPYPIVKHSPSGKPVLVVTAASSCKLLGHKMCIRDSSGPVP